MRCLILIWASACETRDRQGVEWRGQTRGQASDVGDADQGRAGTQQDALCDTPEDGVRMAYCYAPVRAVRPAALRRGARPAPKQRRAVKSQAHAPARAHRCHSAEIPMRTSATGADPALLLLCGPSTAPARQRPPPSSLSLPKYRMGRFLEAALTDPHKIGVITL